MKILGKIDNSSNIVIIQDIIGFREDLIRIRLLRDKRNYDRTYTLD